MTNPHFSFIILTLNEELHLLRLLNSIGPLNAKTYVLDSGSDDATLKICKAHSIDVKFHPFENHPKQWDVALKSFDIDTPWVICLDADQTLSESLFLKLMDFKNEEYKNFDGIYFNRKNYFKGKWIKHGGLYPKYLLKMFRYHHGYSDLTENMDHRFQVPGKTTIWKTAHLIEENLKENQISFWITKHDRYSTLLAEQELRSKAIITQNFAKPKPWRSPNERNAWLKKIWWQLPLYIRPILYFAYRMIFQLGFLDGKTGILFHFLQGFWFRLIVDVKIEEMRDSRSKNTVARTGSHFIFKFLLIFSLIYTFQLLFIGIITPGGLYIKFVDQYFNYIAGWRKFCIQSTAFALESLGYEVRIKPNGLSVKGHSGFRLIYSCLGYGIMSGFSAFVVSFPALRGSKIIFLVTGLLTIQLLNTIRLALISLYYIPERSHMDHHLWFNCMLYGCVAIIIYLFANLQSTQKCKSN